jgi:hypothetical protein
MAMADVISSAGAAIAARLCDGAARGAKHQCSKAGPQTGRLRLRRVPPGELAAHAACTARAAARRFLRRRA